jgi:hypothetical protein
MRDLCFGTPSGEGRYGIGYQRLHDSASVGLVIDALARDVIAGPVLYLAEKSIWFLTLM